MNFEIVAVKADLINEFNLYLGKIPQSQLKFEIKGATVKLKRIKLTKIGLSLDKLFASLAVSVSVVKKTLLTDVTADGIIEIGSYIDYTISRDWQLDSSFHYAKHRWLKKPDISIGLIQFPVESIVDNLIDKQKTQLETTFNQQLASISDLSQYMTGILPYLNQSFNMQSTAFQVVPQIDDIIVTDVSETDDKLTIHCRLQANPSFRITSEPLEAASLPEIIIERAV